MAISAATRPACLSRASRSAFALTLPFSSQATTTTRSPAITADAAFVPCAEDGIRQMSRSPCPCATCQARIARRPANSPCEPALGWTLTASYPVIAARKPSRDRMSRSYPAVCAAGAKGCRFANSGHEIGSISLVALSFIVHEPSGIMERSSATSYPESRRR